MKIAKALQIAQNRLNSKNAPRELLKFSQNFSDNELILNLSTELLETSKFWEFVSEFENGKPLEYITNQAEFFDLKFYVDENVLIPRFETEILVSKTLEIARNFTAPKILEIGVGSGIISICLKKNLKNAKILAVDISENALKIAAKNAKTHNVEIEFKISNLLENVSENFDIIVSNPPYIAKNYPLDKFVLNEPKIALFGGDKGSEILENLIFQSQNRCKFLCCEMGYDQREILSVVLKNANFRAEFYKDLAGFDRGFVAENE